MSASPSTGDKKKRQSDKNTKDTGTKEQNDNYEKGPKIRMDIMICKGQMDRHICLIINRQKDKVTRKQMGKRTKARKNKRTRRTTMKKDQRTNGQNDM